MLARVWVFLNVLLIKWFRCSINAVWLDSIIIQWLGTILLILNNCWCRMSMYRCSWDLYSRLGLNTLKCRNSPCRRNERGFWGKLECLWLVIWERVCLPHLQIKGRFIGIFVNLNEQGNSEDYIKKLTVPAEVWNLLLHC